MTNQLTRSSDALLDDIIEELTAKRHTYCYPDVMPKVSGSTEWLGYLRKEAVSSFVDIFMVPPERAKNMVAETEKGAPIGEIALAELVTWQRLITETGRVDEAKALLRGETHD